MGFMATKSKVVMSAGNGDGYDSGQKGPVVAAQGDSCNRGGWGCRPPMWFAWWCRQW
jgi:hypothetical protein